MKAIILAAGYATRLYPLTIDTPKPLLEICGKTVMDHLLQKIETLKEVDEIYVVTNDKFYAHFQKWVLSLKTTKRIKIVNDHTTTNENRLGAIGDIHYVIEQEKIHDDLLVIAGDNLFGFSLQNFISFYQKKKTSILAFVDLKDKEKVKGRLGVGILDGSKVIDFEEKPLEPKSALAATVCYLLNQKDYSKIKNLLLEEKADAPGHFIKYLAHHSEVSGFIFDEHWFDIGTFESLEEAKRFYNEH